MSLEKVSQSRWRVVRIQDMSAISLATIHCIWYKLAMRILSYVVELMSLPYSNSNWCKKFHLIAILEFSYLKQSRETLLAVPGIIPSRKFPSFLKGVCKLWRTSQDVRSGDQHGKARDRANIPVTVLRSRQREFDYGVKFLLYFLDSSTEAIGCASQVQKKL